MNGLVIAAQMLFWAFTMVSFVLWWRAITQLTKAQKKLAKQRRPRYRVPLLVLLTLLTCHATASNLNPTGRVIPNDAQGTFLAGGGFGAICDDLALDKVLATQFPVLSQWYVRLPVETVLAYGFWYLVQSQSGAIPTKENDANRATCAAIGAAGVSGAMICETWNFAVGGCK